MSASVRVLAQALIDTSETVGGDDTYGLDPEWNSLAISSVELAQKVVRIPRTE